MVLLFFYTNIFQMQTFIHIWKSRNSEMIANNSVPSRQKRVGIRRRPHVALPLQLQALYRFPPDRTLRRLIDHNQPVPHLQSIPELDVLVPDLRADLASAVGTEHLEFLKQGAVLLLPRGCQH